MSFSSNFSNSFDEHQFTQTNASKRRQFYNALNFENISTLSFSSFSNRSQKNHNRSFSSTRRQSTTNISRHATINSKIESSTSRRFNNIFEITTKKIIYNRFIDSTFDFSNMSQQQSFDAHIQRFLNAIVIKAIKIYIQRNSFQQKSSNSSNSQNFQNFQKNDDINVENDENDNNSRWNVDGFDFFDSMYENKFVHIDDFIIQIEKNIYFRDVYYFLRRTNDIVKFKKTKIVRQNLWICFKNTALKWWINELIDNEQFMIIFIFDFNDKFDQWTRLLHVRFKTSFNIIFDVLFNERYTLRDAVNRRELKKYVQKIFRLIKDVSLNNVKNQLNIIYNDINSSLRKKNIKRFKKKITINDMLKNLNDCKHDWWNYEAKTFRVQNKQSKFAQNDQYDFNRNEN